MTTVTLAQQARSLWAKSDRGQESGSWHPVWCHLLDVAAAARQILRLEPRSTLELFARDLGMTTNQAGPWVEALVGLHDLGKASPAFQQKNEAGRQRVFDAGLDWAACKPAEPPKDVYHSIVSQWALAPLLESDCGWSEGAACLTADAVGAHHGWRIEERELGRCTRREVGPPIWDEMRRWLFHLVLQVVGADPGLRVRELSAQAFQRLAGLTSFADWIGSSLDFGCVDVEPQEYWESANARAAVRLGQIGWRPRTLLRDERPDFATVFQYLAPGGRFLPRPLQTAVSELLRDCVQPTLLLVEAPMGEGKTEAAFYAHLELQRQLGHRGLYVALPTRATGNAMFERTVNFLREQRRDVKVDVHLLHGSSWFNETYQELAYRPNDEDADDGVTAESYFMPRKRALLSEYGVGTIDQALYTILPVKHQFVRLWGLGNRVVIIDEVHAYDTYTGSLLLRLVEWLRALGSSVVLISATLPAARRTELLTAWGADSEVTGTDYPRATVVIGGKVRNLHFEARPQASVEIVARGRDLEETAAALLEDTRCGGCAVCIVNTVGRAQELYQLLDKRCDYALLFHARFPMDDRQRLENAILERFGKAGRRPERAILVATQVVEQSLDLDFDVMYTDLAPVDLVLQRCGRLHRHNRSGRGRHDVPRLHVLGLANSPPELDGWNKVYEEYTLLRSWLCLREVRSLGLPDDIDRLVQEAYGEREPWGDLAEPLRAASDKMQRAQQTSESDAHYNSIGSPLDGSWKRVGPRCSTEEEGLEPRTQKLSTREGEDSVTVVPVYKVGNEHFLDEAGTVRVPMTALVSQELARSLFARSLSISRRDVVSHLRKPKKRPWQKTPALLGLFPLVVNEPIGGLSLHLDERLGLVYR